MEKTPISILQEFTTHRGSLPTYSLVHNGTGTHNPLFIYEVYALGFGANGQGKSKKEAKHNAAKALYEMLVGGIAAIEPHSRHGKGEQTKVKSPYEEVITENAVGELQDFCLTIGLESPTFILTRDEGLPHAKVFEFTCRVSSFECIGGGRTKKQAKHVVSRMILQLLRRYAAHVVPIKLEDNEIEELDDYESMCEKRESLCRYYKELGVSLDKPFDVYKELPLPTSTVLDQFEATDLSKLEDPYDYLCRLIQELGGETRYELGPTAPDKPVIVYVIVSYRVPFTFIGIGSARKEALKIASLDALECLKKVETRVVGETKSR